MFDQEHAVRGCRFQECDTVQQLGQGCQCNNCQACFGSGKRIPQELWRAPSVHKESVDAEKIR